ncbi:hypothetical protein ACFX1Z_013547 [Malus domestica]
MIPSILLICLFSGEEKKSTIEHIARFSVQCGETRSQGKESLLEHMHANSGTSILGTRANGGSGCPNLISFSYAKCIATNSSYYCIYELGPLTFVLRPHLGLRNEDYDTTYKTFPYQ